MVRQNRQKERIDQGGLVSWIRLQHKDVFVVASANGAIRSAQQARFAVREGVMPGMPDLQICRAAGEYHGLFIELKRKECAEHKKGVLKKNQKECIEKLNEEGYLAVVCYGFDDAKDTIDWYLGLEKTPEKAKG
tara:strand:+ start:12702 stop:13103 length:402 start_codon:yes stop_codon:yes gene_type:complete